jgi:CRISPR-associated protein Cas2
MRGFGDHVQYSVFRCDLSQSEKVELISTVGAIINHDRDQVLLIALGPPDGRGKSCIDAVGRPYTCPERHAIVI